MSKDKQEELRERLLAVLVDGTPNEERYVDTKAKFILDDIVPVIDQYITDRIIEELERALNEYNFMQEEVERPTKELKIGNKYLLNRIAALRGKSNG